MNQFQLDSQDPTPADYIFMQEALLEAEKAAADGEVPVGAVLVKDGQIIVRAHNQREMSGDPTAHAEIIVLQEAAKLARNWRLTGLSLYVTLEPCTMCAGALVLARIDRLIYGARDSKAGAVGSLMNIVQDERLNHYVKVSSGVMEAECGKILKDFFRQRRKSNRTDSEGL